MSEYPGFALHQIGPYIGKIRPSLARRLVSEFSKKQDWVWDPFCGSGTIALESRLLDRNAVAGDINPYACALTRAKLHAPPNAEVATAQITIAAQRFARCREHKFTGTPMWVRKFFHKKTFKEAMGLMAEFAKTRQYFNSGCLLSILHHQRPGFLSYPASHLVPYLRDHLYPRGQFPEAYQYRDPIPRLEKKVRRVLRMPPPFPHSRFRVFNHSVLRKYLPDASMDVIITSPPYMNALDYARDNRLRLWFLGVHDYQDVKQKEIRSISNFRREMTQSLQIAARVLKPKGSCVLVLGDVTRSDLTYDVPHMILELVKKEIKVFEFENSWVEELPDDRRARRNGRATRRETVLTLTRKRN